MAAVAMTHTAAGEGEPLRPFFSRDRPLRRGLPDSAGAASPPCFPSCRKEQSLPKVHLAWRKNLQGTSRRDGDGERLLLEPLPFPFFFPPLPAEGDLPRLLSRTCSKGHESPLAHLPVFWYSKQWFSPGEGDERL